MEPSEAPILTQGKWGTHKIEGIGDGFVPKNLDLGLLNGVITVSSSEAIEMANNHLGLLATLHWELTSLT